MRRGLIYSLAQAAHRHPRVPTKERWQVAWLELEVPMDLEEEERIWSAFKQASPTELTGGADALDKESEPPNSGNRKEKGDSKRARC